MLLPALVVSALLSMPATVPADLPAGEPAAKARAEERVVWTNEAVEQLSGGITVFEPAMPALAAPETAPAPAPSYVFERDPEWYRRQLTPLEEQVSAINAKMAQIRTTLSDPLRYGSAAFPFGEAAIGRPRLSPENELAMLEQERATAMAEIDRIRDLARQNWLPPAVAR